MAGSVSLTRRAAATGALLAAGGAIVASTTPHLSEWPILAAALGIGAAGVGLSQKSLLVQAVSRSVAWLLLVPSALAFGFAALRGQPDLLSTILFAGSGSALLLARPMLHTDEAKKQFSPVRGRSWFLAGATLTCSAFVISAFVSALLVFADGWLLAGAATGVVAAAYLASAAAVLRMRSWGVLLGGLMSIVSLVLAAVFHSEVSLLLALAALPGAFFGLSVLAARLASDTPRIRVDAPSVRTRIDADLECEDLSEGSTPAAARSSL